jgi:hypothetical protein
MIAKRLGMGGERANAGNSIGRHLALRDVDEVEQAEAGHGDEVGLLTRGCKPGAGQQGRVKQVTEMNK